MANSKWRLDGDGVYNFEIDDYDAILTPGFTKTK